MPTIPKANDDCNTFSGYFFKVPDELIQLLDTLSPAELKAYLVVLHGIQKDRNEGLLSVRQVADRSKVGQKYAHAAMGKLTERGLLKVRSGYRRTGVYEIPFSWKTSKDSAHDCAPTGEQSKPQGIQNRTPTGIQHLESLEYLEKTSSSSGSSEASKQKDEEDDGSLKTFLHEWMNSFQSWGPAKDAPRASDVKDIRSKAPGWSDAQIIQGFRLNAISRAPNPKDPPKGYRYFATVIGKFYEEENGIAPELPKVSPSAKKYSTEGNDPNAYWVQPDYGKCKHGALGICTSCMYPDDEDQPKKRPNCQYCNDTGTMNGRKQLCQACEVGQDRIKQQREEQAEKAALEADNKLYSKQTEEWLSILREQPDAMSKRMAIGDLGCWFSQMYTPERAAALNQIRAGEHPEINISAHPMPMATASSAAASAAA
jgi:hypothetical protein